MLALKYIALVVLRLLIATYFISHGLNLTKDYR